MEEMMGHWLSISAGIFLLAMVLYGHYRGFLRMSVNLLALILSIGIVRMTAPYITTYIRENTQLHHTIENALADAAGPETQRTESSAPRKNTGSFHFWYSGTGSNWPADA